MSKSWRRESSSPTPQAGRYWQEQQKRKGDGASGRRWIVPGLFLLSFALLGWLVYKLLFLPRDLVVFPITVHYEAPIPVNGLVDEDVKLFEDLLKDNFSVEEQLVADAKNYPQREEFLAEFNARLGELRPEGPTIWQKSVVLYLSAHGVVDREGNPCLLLPKSDAHDCSNWLKVETLIHDIQNHENLQKADIVLLLDCGRIRDCWPLGVFENDFANRLREVVKRIGGPRLYVINAGDTGQRTWTAPELNGTVFGHFVAKGLAGLDDDNGRVTVLDLVDYLQTNVSEYTSRFRAATQRPFLVGRSDNTDDCQLSFALHNPKIQTTPSDGNLLQAKHDQVAALWKTYEQVAANGVFRFQPMRFGKVANQLSRLEELIPAGQAYQGQFDDTRGDTETELDELTKAPYAVTNVATTAAVMARVRDFDHLYDMENAFIPQQEFATWLSDRIDPDKEPTPPMHGRDATALAVWAWLSERTQVRREDIQAAQTYLNLAGQPDVAEQDASLPSEIHFTRLLDRYLPWDLTWEPQKWESIIPRALAIQRQAEELAAPEDVRAFYWSHDDLNQAEQKLRAARDQLFVGNDDALQAANLLWDELNTSSAFDKIQSVQKTVLRAYRVRDKSFALTPYFARWATATPVGRADRMAVEQRRHLVNQLVAATQQLGKQLDLQGLTVDVSAIDATEGLLDRLQKEFESDCAYCLGSGNKAVWQAVLRDITGLLRHPLPTRGADYHNKLRQKLMQQRWLQKPELILEADTSPATPPRSDRPAMLRGGDHPASRILLTRQDDVPLAQLGGEVRDHLKTIHSVAEGLATETDELLGNSETDLSHARTARRPLSEADQKLRWAASFMPELSVTNTIGLSDSSLFARDDETSTNSKTNFVQRLWKYDYHFFLLWHGWRSLRDLWGPDPYDNLSRRAFYSQSVARCLAEAEALYQGGGHYRALDNAATATANALKNWRPLLYEDVALFDDPNAEGGLVEHRMRFQPLAAGKKALQSQLQLNDSSPAIFVENSNRFFPWFDRNIVGASATPLPRQTPKSPQMRHAFDSVALKDEPNLRAVTLFRGHVIRSPLPIDTGIEAVVFQRPSPTPTTVVVSGDRGNKTQIVFVLDCSRSMAGTNVGTTKMAQAKQALREILGQIKADEQRFEVSLYVFAREQKDPNQKDKIEELVAMGAGADHIDEIGDKLASARPYGRTPLYKSIATASRAFRQGRPIDKRMMIVITDGENFVTTAPRDREYTAAQQRQIEKAENDLGDQHAIEAGDAVRKSKCQVEIVGFGVPSDRRRGPSAQNFARRSDSIQFSNYKKIDNVKQEIVESIGLKTYSVSQPKTTPKGFLNFGSPWLVQDRIPGRYEVAVRNGPSEQIMLHGNEAIEMVYENQRLVHVRYRRDDPQKRTADHVVRFHTHGIGGAVFGISLQRSDRRFTPRPQRALMSIRPVGKSEMVFYGHEIEFQPERPVPVMNYRLAGWPKDEARAQIELSYSMQAPIRTRKVTLNLTENTLEQPFGRNVRLQLETTPSRSGGPVRIAVSEIHEANSRLFPLHLTLNPEPLSARHSIERRLPGGKREIKHVFAIEPDRIQNAEVSLQVITPDERRDTWVSVDPITLDVHHWTGRR